MLYYENREGQAHHGLQRLSEVFRGTPFWVIWGYYVGSKSAQRQAVG